MRKSKKKIKTALLKQLFKQFVWEIVWAIIWLIVWAICLRDCSSNHLSNYSSNCLSNCSSDCSSNHSNDLLIQTLCLFQGGTANHNDPAIVHMQTGMQHLNSNQCRTPPDLGTIPTGIWTPHLTSICARIDHQPTLWALSMFAI